MTSLRYLLNCRSFIFLVVLFSFIDNFSMEEEDEQFFEGISIKKLENGDDIAQDEIYFYKSFAFIGINYCVSIFKKLFYPNINDKDGPYKDIYYSIGEKKIHLRFTFFYDFDKRFLSALVTNQKLNYDYFFFCFYTCLRNEKECIKYRSSIYNFLKNAGFNEILNDNIFYFVADTWRFQGQVGNINQTDFSEENINNLEKYGKVLITNTNTGENLLCKIDKEKEIHLNEENANTVEGCWLKIVLSDLNKKMKEEKKEKEIENLQEENSENKNENKKVEENDEENCCENICTFIKNCF